MTDIEFIALGRKKPVQLNFTFLKQLIKEIILILIFKVKGYNNMASFCPFNSTNFCIFWNIFPFYMGGGPLTYLKLGLENDMALMLSQHWG